MKVLFSFLRGFKQVHPTVLLAILASCLSAALLTACSGDAARAGKAYESAISMMLAGDYEKSLAMFDRALALAPDDGRNARIYNFIGVIRWKLDDKQGSRNAFERSRELNPLFSPPFYNMGLQSYLEGDAEEAAAMLSRAIMTDSSDLRSRDLLARIYRRNGRLEEAERVLVEALKTAPDSPMILTSIGIVELQKGNLGEAVGFMDAALGSDPAYPPALYNLGMIYMRRKDKPVQALKYFEQYLAAPPDSDSHKRAAEAIAKHLRALIATSAPGETPGVASSDIAAVQISFEELLAEAEKMAKNKQEEAAVNVFLRAADMAARDNNIQRQEKAIREAIDFFPNNPRPYYALARLMQRQKKTREALDYCKKAAMLSENWFDVQMTLARLAIIEGETDVALIALQQAVQNRPDSADAQWMLAEFYDKTLKIPQRSEDAYARFQRNFPNDDRVKQAEKRLAALRAGR